MAGLVLELVGKQKLDVEVRLIHGMTASIAAASLLGAPLMHDFCHISLSDLLTPWPVIEKRIVAAGEADFVICFTTRAAAGAKGIWRARLTCLPPVKRADAGWRGEIRWT